MPEIFIPLAEAADLEGVSYDNLRMRTSRNPGRFTIKKEKRDDGGKELVLIQVSCLSKKARSTWKEREHLKELASADPESEEAAEERPWYVDEDLDWYMNHHKKEWYQAMELRNVIREFLSFSDKGKTDFAETFAQERIGKGKRTLYRYAKAYQQSLAWSDKLQKEDGGNYDFFQILSLCRKPKEAGTFPSFTPEVKQVIKNIWFNKEFAQNQGTREMLYDKLVAIAELNEWSRVPSYQSVVRYISHLMNDENLANAWFLASRGTREYKNKIMVKASRDTKSLKVMGVVMGDEHTFDCWVSYTYPNGKVAAVKPHLACWIDMRSRAILGDVMCKDANSDVLKQSLLKMMYSHPGGIPEYIHIDNGKDYTSKTMRGKPRNERNSYEEEPADRLFSDFDDETVGFYKSIGIKDDHRARPYEPWNKAQIERFFRTVCNRFTKWMTSYTGTLTGSKTFAKVNKDINGMLERGQLMSMEEFYGKWSEWLQKEYMVREHGGLKKVKEEWRTPLSCFENAERYEKAVPPKSYATMLMMKSDNRLVQNTGIHLNGIEYRSDDLCDYNGKKVSVKYDPEDMATIYVFVNGKKVCEAYSQELLQIAPKIQQKAVTEHNAMQKRQFKRDNDRWKETQRSLEEINDQYVGFSETTGGIDLMVGPKKKASKVVQLPQDRTYQNGFRPGSGAQREDADQESDYMSKKGEEALKEIRAL